ncbi:MAG: hypothetical protein KDK34_06550, partial [Leptospiraceae bacterium]|nr:hypothetical protein [Leptospiraceae bacterium]
MKHTDSDITELQRRMEPYFHTTDHRADAVVTDFSRMRPGEGTALLNKILKSGIEQFPDAP